MVEVDGDGGILWGRCLRVRVRLELTRPMVRMLCLCFPDDDGPVVVALADFCFTGGMMEHIEVNCSLHRIVFEHGTEMRRDFGNWIRGDGNEPFLAEHLAALIRE